MGNKKISELDQTLNLSDQADFPLSQDNGGTPTTFKAKLTQIATKIAEAITFSNLKTGNKQLVSAVNQTISNIAEDFNTTAGSTYAKDDCVLYNGVLYQCSNSSGTTSGTFIDADWTAVKAVDVGSGGGGGASAYSDLTDVQLSNLQDGQISKYDSTAQKWKNAEDKAEHTGSASGAIATFETDVVANLKSLEVDINAVQASGTPTPSSPLPITGFSQADIGVMGKNLFDGQLSDISSTIKYRQIKLGNGTYTMSTDCPLNTADASNVFFFGGYVTSGASTATNGVYLNNPRTVTTTDGYITVAYRSSSGVNPTNYTFQIEKGNQATPYEPYTGNLYTVAFGQTIYGGRLIYSNGAWSIEATSQIVDLGDLQWTYRSDATAFYSEHATNCLLNPTDCACSCYEFNASANERSVATISRNLSDLQMAAFNNANNQGRFLVKDLAYTDATAFTTAVTGQKLLYPLETPVIIPITSSTRVKTINGLNNIYSNTGDVSSVEFFKNTIPAQVINGTSPHTYSTDEQIVGKWIDGSILYEKTFNKSNLDYGNNTWWNNILGTNGSGIEIVRFEGYYSNNQNNARYSINAFYRASTTTASACVNTDLDDINLFNNMGFIIDRVNVTIRYIKVSNSNNRNLMMNTTPTDNIEEEGEENNENTER